MKNVTRKEQSEELATQGYQRRFFNRSPLVVELASALDQALAEIEPVLTDDDDSQDGSNNLASPFVSEDQADAAE